MQSVFFIQLTCFFRVTAKREPLGIIMVGFQVRCHSFHPTNSVKVLKFTCDTDCRRQKSYANFIHSSQFCRKWCHTLYSGSLIYVPTLHIDRFFRWGSKHSQKHLNYCCYGFQIFMYGWVQEVFWGNRGFLFGFGS